MFEDHSLECNIYIVYLTTTCSHASSNKTDGFTAFVKYFRDVRQQQHISLTLQTRIYSKNLLQRNENDYTSTVPCPFCGHCLISYRVGAWHYRIFPDFLNSRLKIASKIEGKAKVIACS